MAPYESSDTQLIFKVFHVASMGLDQGERVLEDNDWEVDYGFENGVLTSIAVQSPALLYNGMADNIDPQIIEGVDPSAFQEAARTRDSILEQLKGAFDQAQLEVGIDETTGEAVLDSSVLFEVDSYELSDEGKAFLDSFCSVYASVLLNDEYSDAVSAIVFEGHTDTNASYEYNLELSQTRGYSFSDPVYDENGSVDMEASRRVAVKFYINVD